MADTVVFIDIETLGLIAGRHAVWEIGYVARVPGEAPIEKVWTIELTPEQLADADPTALRINRFYERYKQAERTDSVTVAFDIAHVTAGAWLVGSNPAFDDRRLEEFLRANGFAPAWHYRLVCVENLAAGALRIRPGADWDPTRMGELLGVGRPENDKHTALGDARWAMRMHDAVYALTPSATAPAAPPKKAVPAGEEDAAEPAVEPPPPSSKRAQRPSTEEPTPCEECGNLVPPDKAMLSFSRHEKVLCFEPDGGCYSRFGQPEAADVKA